ncbi:MAG: hypothetical protein GWO41_08965, partial [candidate division Zixibacteria bacterium]|nr:hypothetical protein [Gammaproteobacteria bacterium]NIT52847.1 hypothetical protein [candidate division Zixibacteria bacterium]NIX55062.1 hypothetical protein [candidate division Zixibacteria bacterium]
MEDPLDRFLAALRKESDIVLGKGFVREIEYAGGEGYSGSGRRMEIYNERMIPRENDFLRSGVDEDPEIIATYIVRVEDSVSDVISIVRKHKDFAYLVGEDEGLLRIYGEDRKVFPGDELRFERRGNVYRVRPFRDGAY